MCCSPLLLQVGSFRGCPVLSCTVVVTVPYILLHTFSFYLF